MISNVTMSGSIRAAVVSVGAVADSTCTAIPLWGGMQHSCRNKTITDSTSVLTVTTER